jgi:hypothetical protein
MKGICDTQRKTDERKKKERKMKKRDQNTENKEIYFMHCDPTIWYHFNTVTEKLTLSRQNRIVTLFCGFCHQFNLTYYKQTQNCIAITVSDVSHISRRPVFSKSQVLIQFSPWEICE